MMHFGRRKPAQRGAASGRTSVSFTADELLALGQLLAAGQVVLQPQERLPVISRLKAAMTRLGIAIPRGL